MFDVPQGLVDTRQTRPHPGQCLKANRHRLLLARQNPVRDHRPRDRQKRQDRYYGDGLHMVNVAPECGRKRQSLVRFQVKAGK